MLPVEKGVFVVFMLYEEEEEEEEEDDVEADNGRPLPLPSRPPAPS